jgi:hypothetical protein
MNAVATRASVCFGPGAEVKVEPFIRLTGSTNIYCCTYDDHAPILAIDDGNVSVSLTVPDVHHVTGEDVNRALALADAVARYAAELGAHLADDDCAAPDAAA